MCTRNNGRSHFHDKKEVMAKKLYECVECKNPILPGTKHFYLKGVWEDDCGKNFWSCRMCPQCEKDWETLKDVQYEHSGETCIIYGCLKQKIGEALDDGIIDESHSLVKRWFPKEPIKINNPNQLEIFPQ